MKPLLLVLFTFVSFTVHAQLPTNKYLDWLFRADDAVKYQGATVAKYVPVYPGPFFTVTHEGEHRFVYDYNHLLTAAWYNGQPSYHIVRYAILDSVNTLYNRYFPGTYFNSHVDRLTIVRNSIMPTFIGYKFVAPAKSK